LKNSFQKAQITSATGQSLVRAALEHACKNDWEVAVAVVDPSGHLVAFGRTDRAASPVGEFALDKAYTAGTLGKSTRTFGERMVSSTTFTAGLSTRQRLMAWGGGVPIIENGVCIGGLGVSGAQEDEDIDCAEVAIHAVGLSSG